MDGAPGLTRGLTPIDTDGTDTARRRWISPSISGDVPGQTMRLSDLGHPGMWANIEQGGRVCIARDVGGVR
jgi:hypothetical protein